jgi:hypothetical protein
MFFVCHSPKAALSTDDDAWLHVWAGDRLADVAIRAGQRSARLERASPAAFFVKLTLV